MTRAFRFVFTCAAAATAGITLGGAVAAQYKPTPGEIPPPKDAPRVISAPAGSPPSDAIVLFDGKDLSQWQSVKGGGPARWEVRDGAIIVIPKTGDIQTTESFGDVQLHIEWATPTEVSGKGQERGNSGVFLQGRYEVQVLDSWQNETYYHGQAAAVYKQHAPLVNAARQPGEWQTYDIVFRAPKFDASGRLTTPAYLTVFHNGVLVQDHVEVKGTTTHTGAPKYEAHGDAPLLLQDHDNRVRFRNIWIRRL